MTPSCISSSDRELTELLRVGNHEAFEVLYERYKGVLHLHAYKKLGNLEEAQDLIQELFVWLWQKRACLPDTGNFSGYLYVALRNRILDAIAHHHVEDKYSRSLQQFISDEHFVTDRTVRERELSTQINGAVSQLPPKMQEVFIMSRTTLMSHRAIAEKLGISENTVKNHIKGALTVLRGKFGLIVLTLLLPK